MKVRVAIIVGLLAITGALGQAPYPPNGYRPQGRQFNLPQRPDANQGSGSNLQPQNQFGAPHNQYGTPVNQPQQPPSQYLPGSELDPSDLRFNFGNQALSGQNNQHALAGGQHGYSGSNQQGYSGTTQQSLSGSGQQGYSGTAQQPYSGAGAGQQGYSRSPQQSLSGSGQQGFSGFSVQQQQYSSRRQQSYQSQQQNFNPQDQNQDAANANNQQGWNANSNSNQDFQPVPSRNPAAKRYLAPKPNVAQNQQQYETSNDDQDDRQNFGVNSNYVPNKKTNQDEDMQDYPPPTTTERRRYPEPTTRRPDREPVEPQSNEAEDPNVAIATAVARGQYYLLQPDGRLQRVVYKTTQTGEDLTNSVHSAKLVYQYVEPITAPIYTYNAPLQLISG